MASPLHADTLEFGDFRVHRRLRIVVGADGDPVHLTAKAFDALMCFLESPGAPIARDALMTRIWTDTVVEENNLTQTIAALRKIFGSDTILTIPRHGYQFAAEVHAIEGETDKGTRADSNERRTSARSSSRRVVPIGTAALAIVVALVVLDIYFLRGELPFPEESSSARFPAVPSVSESVSASSPEAVAAFELALATIQEDGYSNGRALAYLNEAIGEDATYGPAYLFRGIAVFLRTRSDMNAMYRPPISQEEARRSFTEAERDLQFALRIRSIASDPALEGYAHAVRGAILVALGEDAAAQGSFDRARQFAPRDPDVITFVAASHLGAGRRDEARELLEGLDPDVLAEQRFVEVMALAGLGDIAETIQEQTVQRDLGRRRSRVLAGLRAAGRGDTASALVHLRLVERLLADDLVTNDQTMRPEEFSFIAYVYGRIGEADKAKEYFDKFMTLAQDARPPRLAKAYVEAHLAIGELEQAHTWAKAMATVPLPPFLSAQLHFVYNTYDEPVFETEEFLELRRQMGYRD